MVQITIHYDFVSKFLSSSCRAWSQELAQVLGAIVA